MVPSRRLNQCGHHGCSGIIRAANIRQHITFYNNFFFFFSHEERRKLLLLSSEKDQMARAAMIRTESLTTSLVWLWGCACAQEAVKVLAFGTRAARPALVPVQALVICRMESRSDLRNILVDIGYRSLRSWYISHTSVLAASCATRV